MVKADNPAGRLYSLLLSIKKLPPSTTFRAACAKCFDVDEKDLAKIYGCLLRLDDSLREIEHAIRLQDVDHDIYLQHFPAIHGFLLPSNLNVTLQEFRKNLDEGVLMTLQFCSERLSKHDPEKVLGAEELAEFGEELQALWEALAGARIDAELKSVLLDLTEAMRQAIAEYHIRGGVGLRQELFYIFERLQRNLPLLERDREEPVVTRFWDVVGRYDTLSSVCVNAPVVIEGLRKLLN